MRVLLLIAVVCLSTPSSAAIEIAGSVEFQYKVRQVLSQARESSVHLEQLIDSLENSPVVVVIHPISDDAASWHPRGDRTRSHTRALDSLPRRASRDQATESVIYLNEARVTPGHRSFMKGTLIHELVHALDLATGRYHENYVIREKRAVFFQNIWRDVQGARLRSAYHDRFPTLEYQGAVKRDEVEHFVEYYFNASDTP